MAEDKPDIKQELSSLWKLAVDQLDEIKDVIVQGTEAGRHKLDTVMLRQNREKVFAELGKLVHQDPGRESFPAAWQKLLQRVDEIEADIASRASGPDAPAHEARAPEAPTSDAKSPATVAKDPDEG